MDDYKMLSAQCKDEILEDKQKWADDLATEAEVELNNGQVKDAFANLRRLRSACPRISSPIFLPDGTLVSDKPQKLQRWRDYYSELLNRPKAPLSVELQDTVTCAIPDDTIDCTPPTCREVHRAIYRLKDGKAPGLCNITAEMLKAAGPDGVEWLTTICRSAWEQGNIPEDWRKGIILPFYKGKGSRHDCHNYRGITLLSVPGKVCAHVLLARVKSRLHDHRRIEQSGFTPKRSTIDRILTLNMIYQQRREFNQPLWVASVVKLGRVWPGLRPGTSEFRPGISQIRPGTCYVRPGT